MSGDRPSGPTRRDALLAGGLGGLALLLAACGNDSDGTTADGTSTDDNLGFAGTVLGFPLAKPTTMFTDTSGRPYDIGKETAGKLSLLFFGYTSCPDVCPVHLDILASTLENLTGPASKTNVLFVGVDTARDIPERMREFLDSRNKDFVGLTAAPAEIDAALEQLQLPATVIPENATGDYVVGHASQILAFTPDDLCHIVYPYGVYRQQWAKDLPRLLTFDWPDTRR